MINPETLIEEEFKKVEGDEAPEIFEHVHTFDGENFIVFGGIGQPMVYSYNVEDNEWEKYQNLASNVAYEINQKVLNNQYEIKSQDDMITKIFMTL